MKARLVGVNKTNKQQQGSQVKGEVKATPPPPTHLPILSPRLLSLYIRLPNHHTPI